MRFENTHVYNLVNAIYSARNPLESWGKSDSDLNNGVLGENDLKLAQRLIGAGAPDRKFMRQIFVSVDITAPSFWVSELDTYKIGTVRNSCSLQHKGASRPFTIRDFCIDDERVYDILDPPEKIKKEHKLIYPYETDEYKIYNLGERSYRVYKNGRIVSNAWICSDTLGRNRSMPEFECKPTQGSGGYWYLNIGGRMYCERWLLHRIVAEVWMPTDNINLEINHKDGNKGNNSLENLEWVTHSDNELHKHSNNLSGVTLHTLYLRYKNNLKIEPQYHHKIIDDYKNGIAETELAKKYNVSYSCIWGIINNSFSEYNELFSLCYFWENIINKLNNIRELYNETKDYKYFRILRQIMPMGYLYKFTWTANYEVIRSIISQRMHHRLKEWNQISDESCNESFIAWAKTLPYAEELLFYGLKGDNNK